MCLLLLPIAITACGSTTQFVPRTEVVVVKTDEALLAKVAQPDVRVVTNEDLDRKALRLEKALAECNARFDDIRRAQETAIEGVPEIAARANQSAAPWWRRLFGGGR